MGIEPACRPFRRSDWGIKRSANVGEGDRSRLLCLGLALCRREEVRCVFFGTVVFGLKRSANVGDGDRWRLLLCVEFNFCREEACCAVVRCMAR